ncbi:MAG: aldose 1-epimerase [Leptonema sp. (in: bacteria)]
MISLKNNLISIQVLEDCGFTISKILYKDIDILYFPFNNEIYKKNKELAGIPLLYPFANRLYYNSFLLEGKKVNLNFPNIFRDEKQFPIHGLLLKSNHWKIIQRKKDYVKAQFLFSENWLNYFPFEHTLEYSIELKENQIELKIEIKDLKEPLPISFGFHPYFLINQPKENTAIFLPAKKWLLKNDQMFPIKEEPIIDFFKKNNILFEELQEGYKINLDKNYSWDDSFLDFYIVDGGTKFEIFQKKYIVSLYFDSQFSVSQIYSPKDQNFICIEPMTCKTNAFCENQYFCISNPTTFLFIIKIIG